MKTGKNTSLVHRAVKSTLWLFTSRIALFSLSFLQRIILLRFLVAEDFGIFAVALLTIDVIQSFSDPGINQSLIQKEGNIASYLDSAWTLNILRSFLICGVCFLIAPIIAHFFKNPESVNVIKVLSCGVIIASFRNIGFVYFKKDLLFKYEAILNLITSLIRLIILLLYLLFISKSVWALVWARLITSILSCILTYFIHPYRPKLKIQKEKVKELWSFGKHLWVRRILLYFNTHGDDILLGKIAGTVVLGYYQQAYQISNMVVNEITNKISEVSFPLYSKIQSNKERIKTIYSKLLTLATFVIYPLSGILFIFISEITVNIFGERWLPIVPAVKILCFQGPLKSMLYGPVFLSHGRPDIVRKLEQLRFVLIAVIIFPLTIRWGMTGTSWSLLISGIFVQIYGYFQIKKTIDMNFRDFAKILFPPAALTFLMVTILFILKVYIGDVHLFTLLALILFGLIFYLLCNILLSVWHKEYKVFSYVAEIVKGLKTT